MDFQPSMFEPRTLQSGTAGDTEKTAKARRTPETGESRKTSDVAKSSLQAPKKTGEAAQKLPVEASRLQLTQPNADQKRLCHIEDADELVALGKECYHKAGKEDAQYNLGLAVKYLEKAALLYENEGAHAKAVGIRLELASMKLVRHGNPLQGLQKDAPVAMQTSKGRAVNYGRAYNEMNTRKLKRGGLRVRKMTIDGSEKTVVNFKTTYAAAGEVRKAIGNLRRREVAEQIVSSGLCTQVTVSNGTMKYFGVDESGQMHTDRDFVQICDSLVVRLEGLGTIEIGNDPFSGAAQNKIRVTLEKGASAEDLQKALSLVGLSSLVLPSSRQDVNRLKVNMLIRAQYPALAIQLETGCKSSDEVKGALAEYTKLRTSYSKLNKDLIAHKNVLRKTEAELVKLEPGSREAQELQLAIVGLREDLYSLEEGLKGIKDAMQMQRDATYKRDFYELPLDELLDEIDSREPGAKQFILDNIDRLEAYEDFSGEQQFRFAGLDAEIESLGARGFIAGLGDGGMQNNCETLAGVLKSGALLSSEDRGEYGLTHAKGSSVKEDHERNGADGVYFRAVTESVLQEGSQSIKPIVYAGKIQLVFATSLAEGLPYCHEKDRFGCRNIFDSTYGNFYIDRPTLNQHVATNEGSWNLQNEVIFKSRVDTTHLTAVVYQDTRKEALLFLEQDPNFTFPEGCVSLPEKLDFITEHPEVVAKVLGQDETTGLYMGQPLSYWVDDPRESIHKALQQEGIQGTYNGVNLDDLLVESETLQRDLFAGCSVESARPQGEVGMQLDKPLAGAAKELLLSIAGGAGDFVAFNAAADQLKENAQWQAALKSQIDQLPDRTLRKLAAKDALELRGFDREMLLEIYTAAKEKLERRNSLDSATAAKFDGHIQNLQTRVLTIGKEEMVVLGGGAVNTVYGVTYTDSGTGETKQAVFKPDPSSLDAVTLLKEQHFGTAAASGIPPGKDAHLPYRAVASSVVDGLLYGNDNVSVKTEFVVINGQRGILMEQASGKSPKIAGMAQEKIDLDKHPQVKRFIELHIRHKGTLSPEDLNMLAAMLKVRSVEVKGNLSGKWELMGTSAVFENYSKKDDPVPVDLNQHPNVRKHIMAALGLKGRLETHDLELLAKDLRFKKVEFVGDPQGAFQIVGRFPLLPNFDPNNATTAEGLVKLQIKDIITGECDRHPENYFIDNGGKVTGIDEDCCFGVNALPEDRDVRGQESLKGIIPNNASLMLRMPPVITQELKDQVETLYGNQQQLIDSLKPFVSPEEIQATLSRLERLHHHINDPVNCLVVTDKGALLSLEAKKRINTNNSYWARELLVFSNDQKGWNYLRSHRLL